MCTVGATKSIGRRSGELLLYRIEVAFGKDDIRIQYNKVFAFATFCSVITGLSRTGIGFREIFYIQPICIPVYYSFTGNGRTIFNNNNLGFSAEDRVENIRRIAEVGKLFVDTGIITLAAFISPNNEIREMAAGIIGKEDFLEIYVSTPLEECERRDVKGLYAKARRGEIKNFTGISAPFEAPAHPALSLDTSKLSLKESVDQLLDLILPKVIKK